MTLKGPPLAGTPTKRRAGWNFSKSWGHAGGLGLRLWTCHSLGLGDSGPRPIRGKLSCRERRGPVERGDTVQHSGVVTRDANLGTICRSEARQ